MKPFLLATLALAATPAVAAPRAPNWAAGTPISITVTNRRFIPDRISLRQGRQYVLRFRNASDRTHNFSAPGFFKYARVSPRDAGRLTDNDISLSPGESASLHIVAPTTPNARYEFRSTRLGDAAGNMKGAIYVR